MLRRGGAAMNSDIQLKNWSESLPIQDVQPFGKQDEQCLAEIQQVLERHGLTSRFGVALLHKHFAVEGDEILVERTELEERRLVTDCVKVTDAKALNLITTVWRFDNGVRYGCSFCNKDHCTG
jgi:hypothetical protein